MHTGRKKRRAARGRTDVGEQPYEDPNMQMVLHQPQDSFLQPFMQMMQGPNAERPRIEEPSNSQTSSPTSLKEGSPEPWEELTGQSQPHYQNEELGQTFSGLKLGGLDSRVPSSVTIRWVFVPWIVGTSSSVQDLKHGCSCSSAVLLHDLECAYTNPGSSLVALSACIACLWCLF
jgi:hypothetical protein